MPGRALPGPVAITMGDPAGIGGDIVLKAWTEQRHALPSCVVLDDPARLERLAGLLGLAVPIEPIALPDAAAATWPRALPVLPVDLARPPVPGSPDADNAAAIIASIDRAVALVRAGDAAAVVTNPISKHVLYKAGFRHPGHTEYLAELAGTPGAAVMMLVGGGLRVVPVTIHVALREVAAALTTAAIVAAGSTAAAALRRDFGIAAPRLAVAGLNPHAGENGAIGREEIDIIMPAVERLRDRGIEVAAPAPADTLFHEEARRRYDAVLCMYHDQALIPIKTLDFDGGVNVTLGLPFVRTSPDHGTAFAIAGSGRARATSLIAAIELAAAMAAHRLNYDG